MSTRTTRKQRKPERRAPEMANISCEEHYDQIVRRLLLLALEDDGWEGDDAAVTLGEMGVRVVRETEPNPGDKVVNLSAWRARYRG